ncbi:MAG TPA: glycosyltransferase family 39 protein [Thermoanaerobaculia bacterium]|nr:glycosyltransferase family 39 protein [Thermoanaerobaculia bacterium]
MRGKTLALGLALLVLGLAVRLPALPAALPYMSYVDEGHVMHHAVHLLGERTWDPEFYYYGSLTYYLVAGAAVAWSPVYAAIHGHPLRDDLSPDPPQHYDVLEPVDVLVIGRLVTLIFSLGTVVLTGLLARRLAGPAAGLFAAWLAALVPALVARSAIVNVNPLVAFFVLAALLFAEGAREGSRGRRDAVLAGVMIGLAAATKYPAVLVCLPVALAVLLSAVPWQEKLRRLFLAGGAAAASLVVAMPALVLRTANVLADVRANTRFYEAVSSASFWDQAVHRAEWDLPLEHPEVGIVFLLLMAAGLAVALREREWRRPVWGWLLFAAATLLLSVQYPFRPFRNLLALVPLGCILIAFLYAALRRRLSRPLGLDLAAALLPVVLFAPALYRYSVFELQVKDTRTEALAWLAHHTRSGDRILIAEDLAFLPSRVDRLPRETAIKPWEKAWTRIWKRQFQYVVLGEITAPGDQSMILQPMREWILKNYRLEAKLGTTKNLPGPFVFQGNGQILYILRRVPRPEE